MSWITQKIGAPSQRGFIRRRNFLDNIVDLDLYARSASIMSAVSPQAPSLIAFDFAQAFPS
eukprot:2163805-Pyramimonas_sp.AAC.1